MCGGSPPDSGLSRCGKISSGTVDRCCYRLVHKWPVQTNGLPIPLIDGWVKGVPVVDNPANVEPNITELVDRFISKRALTQEEYQRLCTLVMADGTIDERERREINRLFDAIQTGRVQIRS